jgi:MFS family permease
MLAQAAARYRTFLRETDVVRLLVTSFLTRLPLGTMALSMLLHVRSLTGSFATAGATVGAYLLLAAITAPLLGRVIDRRGPALVLAITGIVCPLALCVLLAAGPLALAPASIVGVAGLAGAFAPQISVLTRTMWRYRFDDERMRLIAYAVDGVLVELAFTLGPALVALLLALASPAAAFGMAVLLTALAVPLFFLSPALRYWHHQPDAERSLLGPLTEPRLIVVYVVTFLFTFCIGLTEIGYPGFATFAGAAAMSGVLLALYSFGSAIGGLVYGALHLHLPADRQLPLFLAGMALPLALQALTASPWTLATLAFLGGTLIAPVFALTAMLVTSIAPPRYATEAFTWLSTCIISGVGAGSAIGGRLLEGPGYPAVLAGAAAAVLAAAVCATSLRLRALRVRAPS